MTFPEDPSRRPPSGLWPNYSGGDHGGNRGFQDIVYWTRYHPKMLKHGDQAFVEALTTLLNTCWDESVVPQDWRKGIIIKLPKKGNLADCNNWRGITLLLVPGKVQSMVILLQMRRAASERLQEDQARFRTRRSCSEQIFILRTIRQL